MKLRHLIIPAAVLALALPASAGAKEITSVKVCGADDCITTHAATVRHAVENGGPGTVGPEKGPFYRVTATMSHDGQVEGRFSAEYLPGERQLRGGDGNWMLLPVDAARAIDRVARDLKAFPASRLDLSPPRPERVYQAQVDEVFDPAAAAAHDDGGGIPWTVPTAIVAALLGVVALIGRRRRRPALGGPSPAS